MPNEVTTIIKADTPSIEKNIDLKVANKVSSIKSIEMLEKLLVKPIKKITLETKRKFISVTKLKTLFHTQLKVTANSIVKQFQPNSSLLVIPQGQASFAGIAPHPI